MYKIIKDGIFIGATDNPTYISQQENGTFVLKNEEKADGIAYNGIVYSLLGRENIPDKEIVMLEKVDSGAELMGAQIAIDNLIVASLEG